MAGCRRFSRIKVELTLNDQLTSLASNRFGREVYRKQIADKMTDQGVVAILPENISDIANSFYEGLFADLSEKYGTDHAHELLVLSTSSDYINQKISDIRETYEV